MIHREMYMLVFVFEAPRHYHCNCAQPDTAQSGGSHWCLLTSACWHVSSRLLGFFLHAFFHRLRRIRRLLGIFFDGFLLHCFLCFLRLSAPNFAKLFFVIVELANPCGEQRSIAKCVVVVRLVVLMTTVGHSSKQKTSLGIAAAKFQPRGEPSRLILAKSIAIYLYIIYHIYIYIYMYDIY